ncbi:MAG: hypothetical protein CVV33_06860 [Methanomicrobiales archaeon HGW-Methanomicrobiales-4]|nr:MAG: hypothetical protein CVV33_06860 [Methanomicrobiales archaeon HGW-Methanomicrobiales-4]
MQNNPYDDLLKNLARLIEQVTGLEQNMHNLHDMQNNTPQIIGCAIITSGVPQDQEIPFRRSFEVNYEIVDAGDIAYLTIALPSILSDIPIVEFEEDTVFITAAGTRAPVELGFRLNPGACSFSIQNGILDATLIKEVVSADTSE